MKTKHFNRIFIMAFWTNIILCPTLTISQETYFKRVVETFDSLSFSTYVVNNIDESIYAIFDRYVIKFNAESYPIWKRSIMCCDTNYNPINLRSPRRLVFSREASTYYKGLFYHVSGTHFGQDGEVGSPYLYFDRMTIDGDPIEPFYHPYSALNMGRFGISEIIGYNNYIIVSGREVEAESNNTQKAVLYWFDLEGSYIGKQVVLQNEYVEAGKLRVSEDGKLYFSARHSVKDSLTGRRHFKKTIYQITYHQHSKVYWSSKPFTNVGLRSEDLSYTLLKDGGLIYVHTDVAKHFGHTITKYDASSQEVWSIQEKHADRPKIIIEAKELKNSDILLYGFYNNQITSQNQFTPQYGLPYIRRITKDGDMLWETRFNVIYFDPFNTNNLDLVGSILEFDDESLYIGTTLEGIVIKVDKNGCIDDLCTTEYLLAD